LEFYASLKDKIEDDVVKDNFALIFAKYKKGPNANKEAIEDLEKKFFAGEKLNLPKKEKKMKTGTKRNFNRLRKTDEESKDESEDVSSNLTSNVKKSKNKNNINSNLSNNERSRRQGNRKVVIEDDSQDDRSDFDYSESEFTKN
jgi:hypothetical protein